MTDKNTAGMTCTTKCWIAGGILGLIVAWALWAQADYRFLLALIIGALVALLGGWVMAHFFCAGSGHHDAYEGEKRTGAMAPTATDGAAVVDPQTGAGATPNAAAPDFAEPIAEREADALTTARGTESPDTTSDDADLPTLDPAERDAASEPAVAGAERVVDSRDVPVMDRAREIDPVVDMRPEDMPAMSLLDEGEPGQTSLDDGRLQETAQDSIVEAQRKSAPEKGVQAGPTMLASAPTGGADDLKRISGVGPKLEGVLNDMGVYTFAQIAEWKAKDIAWVDDRLKFKGRIKRDKWVAQAKKLAKE